MARAFRGLMYLVRGKRLPRRCKGGLTTGELLDFIDGTGHLSDSALEAGTSVSGKC